MVDYLWRLDLQTSPEMAGAYQTALEDFYGAVTQYLDEDERAERIEAFGEVEPNEDQVLAALKAVADEYGEQVPDCVFSKQENVDWLAQYAAKYPPLNIGQYFIYGSHFEGTLPAGKIALKVEAATAFGTGEHASTHGCLLALDKLSRRYRFERPLDMGCGSAILAMAIAKTWGAPVVASDIDPESVRVAGYNAEVNRIPNHILPVCGDGYKNPAITLAGPYDLIMANILARPLSSMAKDLARNLVPGGICILAGFLDRDANWVFAAHRCHGLYLVDRIRINGWQTLVLRKK